MPAGSELLALTPSPFLDQWTCLALDESIPSFRVFSCGCFHHNCILQRISADPDKTPRSVASELGLHCLHHAPKSVIDLKVVICGKYKNLNKITKI